MKYKLVYTSRAVKDIQRLDRGVQQRLGKTLLRYEEDPLGYAEKMVDSKLGTYRFRIGDYRVIFDMEGHRREIYRGR